MIIYLIRHGRQCSKDCNVDVSLSPEGCRQAELVARRLSIHPMDALYSSHLIRARQTAEIINQSFQLPLQIIPELQEMDYGDMTGATILERKENFGSFLKERKLMKSDLPYPGGENYQMVYERVYPVLCQIAESGATHAMVVTHGEAIKAILCGILGMEFRYAQLLGKSMENTSIQELEYQPETRRFYIRTLNDHGHLLSEPELLRKSWRI